MPCACSLTRGQHRPQTESCCKLREGHGLGPSTLLSCMPGPSRCPHQPLHAACASASHGAQSRMPAQRAKSTAGRFWKMRWWQFHESIRPCKAIIIHRSRSAGGWWFQNSAEFGVRGGKGGWNHRISLPSPQSPRSGKKWRFWSHFRRFLGLTRRSAHRWKRLNETERISHALTPGQIMKLRQKATLVFLVY